MAVVKGQSPDVIVVMAHRDDTGVGPGRERQRERHGGAARARPHLRAAAVRDADGACSRRTRSSSSPPTRGAFGGLGALRYARRAADGGHVVAVLNLDALAGSGAAAHRDRRRPAALTGDDASCRRRRGASSSRPGEHAAHPGVVAQLVDLGVPVHALRAGPVRRARDPRDHADERGQPARRRRSATAPDGSHARKLAQLGRSAQETARARSTRASSSRRARRATSGSASRIVRGWAIELVLIALLVPFFVAERRPLRALPAPADRPRPRARGRCARGSCSGCSSGSFSRVLLRSAPGRTGPPRPPNPESAAAGDWRVLALTALARGRVRAAGWSRGGASCRAGEVTRTGAARGPHGRAPRRSGSSRCSSSPRTPSRCSSCCRRCTPGSGCRRCGPRGCRCGSASTRSASRGAALVVALVRDGASASASTRLVPARARLGRVREDDAGRDRARRDRGRGAQLAAAAAGRYAPYPGPRRGAARRAGAGASCARARTRCASGARRERALERATEPGS